MTTTLNRQRLLNRFLRYVQIDTTADPHSETYPSSEGQRTLGRMLADELFAMGLESVEQNEHAIVSATVPATLPGSLPTVALVAHMDTSPEAPGLNVKPQVVESYPGGDIPLPNGGLITVAGCPELANLLGMTLVTTDGTTLLGGDDKAGVAIIMEVAETLLENPHLPHGAIKVLMTCDEEIGHGVDKIDLTKLNATVAYTVDGGGQAIIDNETFSADAAVVTFIGHNIHPAIAKDRMVNSIRAAADFVASLPRASETPETTDGREGFMHVHDIRGGVGTTKVDLILRSFEADDLQRYAERLGELAKAAADAHPGTRYELHVRRQYRNMREGLVKLPEAISLAQQAFINLGMEPKTESIRGGTDGSQLSEKGLPTPNLSSGQHNIHSVLEFACLDEMMIAGQHLIELLGLWSGKRS